LPRVVSFPKSENEHYSAAEGVLLAIKEKEQKKVRACTYFNSWYLSTFSSV